MLGQDTIQSVRHILTFRRASLLNDGINFDTPCGTSLSNICKKHRLLKNIRHNLSWQKSSSPKPINYKLDQVNCFNKYFSESTCLV